jgi:methyltransferase (TIGR00027 family)
VAVDETDASRMATASTAEGAALLRAAGTTESDPRVRNPDTMAPGFVAWGVRLPALVKVPLLRRLTPRVVERMVPGAYYFETARTLHLDAVVRAEAERGIRQLVLLGAGYDSRPYRMADELAAVDVFEVDLPAMSKIKRSKVRRLLGGDPPPNVHYVEIDFTTQDLGERLEACGYDPSASTLFVWSGVAPYLPEDAVRVVLGFVAGSGSPDTSIVFDYCFQEVVDGDDAYYGAPELLARLKEMREPLRSGIPRGRTAEYLAALGLRLEEDLGPQDAMDRYLVRSDGTLHGRPYGFGGLAHARVAGAAV